MIEHCGMQQELFESMLVKTCKTVWRLCGDMNMYWRNAYSSFSIPVNKLNNARTQEFFELILDKHAQYGRAYELEEHVQQRETALYGYYTLWRICLWKCNDDWIVGKANQWFPSVHKYDKTSVEWIMRDLVKRMNSDNACKFGIYLTNYISFQRDTKEEFPKQYLDFLRDELGINWEIANGIHTS